MKAGWGSWLVGTWLAIVAAGLTIGIFLTSTTAIPPLAWTFFAFYGAVAVALAVAAAIQLRKGWTLLHRTAPSV
jgi:hypothetical protein